MIRCAALTVLFVVSSTPAVSALEGVVRDNEGKPIKGARACFLFGDSEGFCAVSDEKGLFQLPESRLDRYRVTAEGYIPRIVLAKDHQEVLVLDRGSVLLIRIAGSAGAEAPETAEVFLVFPNGQRQGPFPGTPAGLELKPLPPGSYGVVVRAEGYSQDRGVSVILEPGSRHEVSVPVSRVPAAAGGGGRSR